MATNSNKPTIMQTFHRYVDREYFVITNGFWGKSETIVRKDRIESAIRLVIEVEKMPDEVLVNGKFYELVEIKDGKKYSPKQNAYERK